MTGHTPIPKVSRLDVITTGARRRWTLEEKQRIVAESLSGPRLTSATARRHGLSPSQLFTWRRWAREGKLAADDSGPVFAPALIASERVVGTAADLRAGLMEIEVRGGRRVRVDGSVDVNALKRVIAALEEQ
jgi:transposase